MGKLYKSIFLPSMNISCWPVALLKQATAYSIVLMLFSLQGCFSSSSSSPSQAITVVPGNNSPTASFASSCVDLDCDFDASNSSDSDGNIVSYSWDFGDGANANGVTGNHTYAIDGTYTVTLTVMDNSGSVSSSTQTISVAKINISPTASFTSNCVDLDCNLNAGSSSDADGNIVSYIWDFGDNTNGSGITASHSYPADGNYTVVLTVMDDAGSTSSSTQTVTVIGINNAPTASFISNCPDLSCSFNASASSDSDGTITNYSWDFGDGMNASGATPNHSYALDGNYLVTLTVTDNEGAMSSTSQTVAVSAGGGGNSPPTASFISSCTDLSCSLDATASTDSDGTIVSYNWDFGDSTAGNGAVTNHSYGSDGSYTVVLTVTDNIGSTSSNTQDVTVIGINNPPTASFTSLCLGLSCNFDASDSIDSDGTIFSYSWDFGDGMSDNSVTASHDYANDGTYSVVLTVTDDDGSAAASTQNITVASINNPPSAAFTFSCVDLDCNFDASTSSDSDGNIVSYSWGFGDGMNGSGITLNHNYVADGSYTVALTVTDDDGSGSSSSLTVTVTDSSNLNGMQLFDDSCSACHGADAQGGNLAPAIVGKTATDITNAINSVQQMKSLKSLTTAEIQAIADYLVTL